MNEESLKIAQIDPRDYFRFEACKRCDFPPCRHLLFGGRTVYGRDFLIIHRRHYNTIRPCPFAAGSFNEAETFFNTLSIQDINGRVSRLLNDLHVVERLRYPAERCLTNWADFAEKIEFLRMLWRDRVYAVVRVPFQKDEKIKRWMDAFYDSYTGISKEEKKADIAGVEEVTSVSGPVQLNIKEIDGPKHLAHNEKCVYMIKGFSRAPTDEERKSVSWVVKLDGKEVGRHEKFGEKFEFTAIGEYVGETITVHPFLRSPSDTLCIKTTIGECLLFDGKSLSWLDKDLKAKKTWVGTSSDGSHTDEAKDGGPIPAGKWVALQSKRQHTPDGNWWEKVTHAGDLKEFGSDRIGLLPFTHTETHGRKEFFIHGGTMQGTAHGIDLTDKMKGFLDEFVKNGKDLVLVVRGKSETKTEKSAVFTDWKQGFGRNIASQNKYNDFIEVAATKYDIDPLLLKSIIAQESNFDPQANNQASCAGLTQIAKNTVSETGLDMGKTKYENDKWVYDFKGDERFNPQKSIMAGALILNKKRNSVKRLIVTLYAQPLSDSLFLKLWVGTYNAGEKTIMDAVKKCTKKNPDWTDLLNDKTPKNSALYQAIPRSWEPDKKYIEISEYVEQVIKRKDQ